VLLWFWQNGCRYYRTSGFPDALKYGGKKRGGNDKKWLIKPGY